MLWAGYEHEWYTAYFHGFFASVSAFTNAGFDVYGNSLIGFSHDREQIFLVHKNDYGYVSCFDCGRSLAVLFVRMGSFFTGQKLARIIVFFFVSIRFLPQRRIVHDGYQPALEPDSGYAVRTYVHWSITKQCWRGDSNYYVFVLIATVLANMRGYKDVKVFGRELEEEDIKRSFVVFFVALCLVFTAVILLTWVEELPLESILFEVCSAFGTTGLSTGITAGLTASGKLILIIMMVIGRIGIINLLLFLKKDDKTVRYHYPKERVIVGQ